MLLPPPPLPAVTLLERLGRGGAEVQSSRVTATSGQMAQEPSILLTVKRLCEGWGQGLPALL